MRNATRTLATAVLLLLSTQAMHAQATVPSPPAPSNEKPVTIAVDLAKPIGPYKPIYSWFGYDEGNFTTMRDGRKLLAELHDLSPVPVYIRAHHLLTSGDGVAELKWSSTNVYTEDAQGKPVYDFKIFDGIFDAYKAAGVRPMVELGFMPEALASGKPPYKVPYPKTLNGSVQSPPKDYAKWQELIRVVTAHLIERYGRENVRQWYFEVWNEPDISYWHATPAEYYKLYDYTVAGVRAALPDAKVGGPAITGPLGQKTQKFFDDFLAHIQNEKSAANGKTIPLDFISFHAKGSPHIADGHVQMGVKNELKAADIGFGIIEKYPRFRSTPIILSEADPEGCAACSSKENPANNYRNGTLYPAYTATAFKGLFDLQDRHKVNLISMLSWAFEFENRDYFEGFRDLATNGVDKPILNLFRMLGLMSGTRVATASDGQVPLDTMLADSVRANPDIDAFATKSEHKADVLLWNYHDNAEPAPASPVTATLRGLPPSAKRVLVTHYRIDDTHSNSYTAWQAMGSPQQPTAEQYAQLQSRAGLELLKSPEWIDVTNGALELKTELPRQSISLVEVSW